MFMALMSILISCSAPLLGGKLGRLAGIHLRYPAVIMLALVVQVLITGVFAAAPKALLIALHLATYVAAGVVLWANRALPGLIIIGIGAMTNAAVIALNGGTLPASARALAAAGWRAKDSNFANSSVVKHPVLPWLGDVVATPSWMPFRNVVSVGDLTILLGVFVLVHSVTQSRVSLVWAHLVQPFRNHLKADADRPQGELTSDSPRA